MTSTIVYVGPGAAEAVAWVAEHAPEARQARLDQFDGGLTGFRTTLHGPRSVTAMVVAVDHRTTATARKRALADAVAVVVVARGAAIDRALELALEDLDDLGRAVADVVLALQAADPPRPAMALCDPDAGRLFTALLAELAATVGAGHSVGRRTDTEQIEPPTTEFERLEDSTLDEEPAEANRMLGESEHTPLEMPAALSAHAEASTTLEEVSPAPRRSAPTGASPAVAPGGPAPAPPAPAAPAPMSAPVSMSAPAPMPAPAPAPPRPQAPLRSAPARSAAAAPPPVSAPPTLEPRKRAPQPDTLDGAPTSEFAAPASEAINRHTTVRWYERMQPRKHYPVLVAFTREQVAAIAGAAQASGGVSVRADKPVIMVVPVFPGCIAAPTQMPVDLTPDQVEIRLWITPVSEGDLSDARVELWQDGKLLDRIPTPSKVASHVVTKVAAAGSAVAGVGGNLLEEAGVNLGAELVKRLPAVKAMIGEVSHGTLVWSTAGTLALISVAVYVIRRARQSDPIKRVFSLA